MELYKPTRKDMKESVSTAKKVSALSGLSFLFHWIDCVFCIIRYGCKPDQYLEGGFYKLRSFDRDITCTLGRGFKLRRIFNAKDYMKVCKDKVEFNRYFAPYIKRDWLYCKETTPEKINDFISKHEEIIVKPIRLTKGKGIHLLDKSVGAATLTSTLIGKDILLEEKIVQHPQMCFGNKSVNTVRFNTILDSDQIPHVVKVTFRCGVGDSVVDNYNAGGVTYPINKEYGRIEGPGGHSSMGQTVFIHPGTDIFMLGREIPYWNEAVAMVKEAAKSIPQLRFIGWDVAITSNGPLLIEGNSLPGHHFEYQGYGKGLYRKILSYK